MPARGKKRGYDNMTIYLQEIGKYKRLKHRAVVKLAKKMEKGKRAEKILKEKEEKCRLTAESKEKLLKTIVIGKEANKVMINSCLKLVVNIAKWYKKRFWNVEIIDLVQEGNIGLSRAVELFDWRRDCQLHTYAIWWIRQSITRYLSNQMRTIRVPVYIIEIFLKSQLVERKLSFKHKHSKIALLDEIASEMRVTPEEIQEIRQIMRRTVSLQDIITRDSKKSLNDLLEEKKSISPSTRIENELTRMILDNALAALDEREQMVIIARYGLDGENPLILEEVGLKMGITRERVRQIQVRALKKLRENREIIKLE